MSDLPKHFNGASKRGVWQYDLGDFESYETDNGMIFDRADYEAYFKIAKGKNLD